MQRVLRNLLVKQRIADEIQTTVYVYHLEMFKIPSHHQKLRAQ